MILRRYIFREIVITFLGVFVLLLLVFISLKMVDHLAQAAAGRIPVSAVLSLVGLTTLTLLGLLVPLCLFGAVLFALGRLQRDNEIIAMAGAGIGGRTLHRNVLQLTAVFAVAIASCSLFFGPWAQREMRDLKLRAEQESDITGVTPGQFKEFSDGKRVVFVRGLSPNKRDLEEVFMQERKDERMTVLSARNAEIATEQGTGHRYALFKNGSSYAGVPGRADYEITYYQTAGYRIDQGAQDRASDNVKSAPTTRLLIDGDPASTAELQWRVSIPIMTVLLSAFAVSLLGLVGRGNRYGALLLAVLVYFTYSNLLGIARTMVKKEHVSPIIGLWWVHLLVLAVILLMENYPALVRAWRERRSRGQTLLPAGG